MVYDWDNEKNDFLRKERHISFEEIVLYISEQEKNEEWIPVTENKEKEVEEAMENAHRTLRKDKRMNIRISERDLKNLKVKAVEEGIPYQTLVSMILHK